MKHQTRRLLLVEDEAIIGLAEAALLRKSGFSVDVVSTADDAVRRIERDPSIELVLMDIELGYGGDGVEAASRILLVRDVPIVFLTGHMDQDAVKRTEGVESYGIVVKDSGESVLLSSIDAALRLHGSRRGPSIGQDDETLTIELPPSLSPPEPPRKPAAREPLEAAAWEQR